MQLKIQSEDLDFSYAGFYNLNLDICDITLVNGNVEFSDAHIIETEISLGGIECGGSRYFTPEHKSPQIENFNDANDAIFKFGFFMCQNRRNRGLLGSAAEDF